MRICDNSAIYTDKLIEVGNNRPILKRAKSKYIGPETELSKDQIVDLGEGIYMVQSETNEAVWHNLNMKTGFCSCGQGVNYVPCKHKYAVSTHFDTAEFSVEPSHDPCQRALYHYIATGSTLAPHMYRLDITSPFTSTITYPSRHPSSHLTPHLTSPLT